MRHQLAIAAVVGDNLLRDSDVQKTGGARPRLKHFGFCCRLPCPILSAFFCGKGGIPNTISVYTISKNALV
jgi:hypothetical protein